MPLHVGGKPVLDFANVLHGSLCLRIPRITWLLKVLLVNVLSASIPGSAEREAAKRIQEADRRKQQLLKPHYSLIQKAL